MRRLDASGVGQRQAGPFGTRDGDEGPGGAGAGAGGDGGAALLSVDRQEMRRVAGREILREADREDMPELAILHRAGVEFGAEDGGEPVVAIWGRVGDRVVEKANEMIGEGDEIIPFLPIATANLFAGENAVGPCRMGVEIAAIEGSCGGEGERALGGVLWRSGAGAPASRRLGLKPRPG